MTLYKSSQTASADSTIDWAEGQAPSSVNDSARAMMAVTAKYRDDIAGAIITAVTSTAYTVSSYEELSVFDRWPCRPSGLFFVLSSRTGRDCTGLLDRLYATRGDPHDAIKQDFHDPDAAADHFCAGCGGYHEGDKLALRF
jgi:hypothetical protein